MSTAFALRADAILRRLADIPAPRVAEVGVLVGALSAELMRRRDDLRVVMIDNWLPAEAQPERYRATGDTNAARSAVEMAAWEARARAAVAPYGRATILKADSVVAAREVADGALDLVFLDADHSYEGVKRDIAAWLPKARRWIGGHDYRNCDPRWDFSGVERAVSETFGAVETDSNFTWFVRVCES